MGLSLTGISGASGILPPPPSSGFNWALLPNVPTNRRSAIEAACDSAASGQAYTANDVFTLLSTANYWWSFEQGSIFTSTDTSVVSNSNGDAIGCARDWMQNALVAQPTSGARPIRASVGLDFDGSNDNLVSSTITLIPTSSNPFMAFVVGAPLRLTTSKGGALLKVGGDVPAGPAGFGLGCGSGTFDVATNPNLVALHEHVAWLPTTTAVSTAQSILTFSRASGTTRLYYGGVQVFTSTANMLTVGTPTLIGGYVSTWDVAPNRHINCKIQSVIAINSWSTTSVAQMHRFLNAYYGLGLSL